jgi:Glucodextranase, domain B
VLRFSAGSEVELREKVEIRLDRVSAAGASVDLRRGKVVARVTAAGDALAITARDTRTSTEGAAHFVVMTNEQGQVSVAALKGSARFASAGKTVTVPEGTETRSQPGQPPEDPERIPEEVLLQVVWPTGERHGETTSVQGRVGHDATVTVNGSRAAVGPDGQFAADVPLRDGPNLLEVETEDLTGRTRRSSTTLIKRSVRAPKLTPEPAELWKK